MKEIWRNLLGLERYQVSNRGKVRSISWAGKSVCKDLCPTLQNNGYLLVGLTSPTGRLVGKLVHRLVLETFVGACPSEFQCAHLNGTRADNRLENLSWVSRAENMSHKKLHGTHISGERHTSAKLTWEIVRKIRKIKAPNAPQIAKEYGVYRSVINKVLKFETWKEK